MVVGVTVVWTVGPCLIIVVGVTGRASIDVPGACRHCTKKAKNITFYLLKLVIQFHNIN